MRRFTGFDGLPPFIAWSPAHLNDDIRHDYLNAYGRRILALWETDPIPYPPLSAYDPETFRLK
ncbi:MAG: hypothetical protein PVF20_03045, partial [Desulfobacterales bacterium]|jgi:NAD(P)H dehydrogenase (quinone)